MRGGIWSQRITGWSATSPSETAWLFAPKDWAPGGKGHRRVIVANHGHGGSDAWGSDTSLFDPTWHIWNLVRAGYVVVAINNLGPNTYGAPNVLRNLDDFLTWGRNTAKMPTTRIGLYGWSMGGFAALNWLKRHKTDVAATWLWTPACDIDWMHNTAGYHPAYDLGTVGTPTGYQGEMNTAYAGSTTATAAVTIPAAGSSVTLPVADAKNFSDVSVATKPNATAPGGTFTWSSKDDTNLYGCTSTGAAFVVASADAITTSFGQQKFGYNPIGTPGSYAAPTGPLRIATADDDATIPVAQSQYFVSQVNDRKVTFREVASGGHTNLFAGVTPDEVVALYDSGAW